MDEKDIANINPIALAFLGDAVFTEAVREKLVLSYDLKAGGLHRKASALVNAAAQADMYESIAPLLTAEEADTARRARNAHTQNKAKHATLSDYKKATSLEAVIGMVKLKGDKERLNFIIEKCVERAGTKDSPKNLRENIRSDNE